MRTLYRTTALAVAFTALGLFAAGCGAKPDKNPTKTAHGHDHPDEGPHGGVLIEWGEEEYHPEFTVDHDKKETVVYLLDGTAKKAPNLKAEDIAELKLTITNLNPPVTIDLKHDPARSNDKGIAFAGTHEKLGTVMDFKGQVSGNVKGKPYVGDFEEKEHKH